MVRRKGHQAGATYWRTGKSPCSAISHPTMTIQTDTKGWRIHTLHTNNDATIRDWLTDTGSLTRRLQAVGTFSVVVLSQQLALPTRDEAALLGLRNGQLAWIREVALCLDGKPVVFAHTALPRHPRGPVLRWLKRLGNRSLGALLFAHPSFSRGPLVAQRLDHRHALHKPALEAFQDNVSCPPEFWARRSSFSFRGQRLLVTEVFSPTVSKLRFKIPLDARRQAL